MKRIDKRRMIYNKLRDDLVASGLSTAYAESLICPLCWREVTYEYLTLEHIIPNALHGKRETLTCINCNGTCGRDLDNHLVGYHRYSEAWAGYGELKMDLCFNGHRVAARMTRNPLNPSTDLRVIGHASDPTEIDAVHQEFENGVREFTATFSMGYNDRRMQLAILKSSYLAVFHRFGYRMALRPGLQYVRQIIQERHELEPDLSGACGEIKSGLNLPGKQIFYFAARIDQIPAVLTILTCRLQTTVYRFAIIPMEEGVDSFYHRLGLYAKEQRPFSLKVKTAFDSV